MNLSTERHNLPMKNRLRPESAPGFTFIEIMIGLTILVIGVLGVATMFGTGYNNVGEGGRTTMAVTAARQLLEDARLIPFANLPLLNDLDPGNAASQPGTGNPLERTIARKWVWSLVGDKAVTGWNFTVAEKAAWSRLNTGTGTGATPAFGGHVTVTTPTTPPGGVLRQIRVTVSDSRGKKTYVQLETLISRP